MEVSRVKGPAVKEEIKSHPVQFRHERSSPIEEESPPFTTTVKESADVGELITTCPTEA